jgi:predicted dithiol-disulfide oxidoreductase (DUF899 family)
LSRGARETATRVTSRWARWTATPSKLSAQNEQLGQPSSVFDTYSSYARGLDPINSGYQLLDLAPRGRDESELSWTMEWLRRHDAYE